MKKSKISDEEWIQPVLRNHQPLFVDYMLSGQNRGSIKQTHLLDLEFSNIIKFQNSYTQEYVVKKHVYEVLTQISLRKKDNLDFMNAMQSEDKKTSTFFEKYAKNIEQQSDTLLRVAYEIHKNNPKPLTNIELANLFSAYSNEAILQASFLFGMRAAQDVIMKTLEQKLKPKLSETEWDAALAILYHPSKDDPTRVRESKLREIASLIEEYPLLSGAFSDKAEEILNKIQTQNHAFINDKINELIKKYPWERMDYFYGKPYTKIRIIEELRQDVGTAKKRIKESEERKKEFEKMYSEWLSCFNNQPIICRFSNLFREFIYLREKRMDVMHMANGLIYELSSEIGKRIGIGFDDLLQLRHTEILDNLANNTTANQELISERRKGYAAILEDGRIKWYSGKGLDEIIPQKIVEGKLKATKLRLSFE